MREHLRYQRKGFVVVRLIDPPDFIASLFTVRLPSGLVSIKRQHR